MSEYRSTRPALKQEGLKRERLKRAEFKQKRSAMVEKIA
jgi:hypothetical protein